MQVTFQFYFLRVFISYKTGTERTYILHKKSLKYFQDTKTNGDLIATKTFLNAFKCYVL